MGIDKNFELKKSDIKKKISANIEKNLQTAKIYVTVPTPIDKFKKPDLKPLLDASKIVSKFLKNDDLVIYNQLFTQAVLRNNVFQY